MALILDRTPFYAEQGGQVGDRGLIHADAGDGTDFEVKDTRRIGPYVLHVGSGSGAPLQPGEAVHCEVDGERRRRTRANHTATHLLNLALRRRTGPGSDQRGSMVAPERLRFDYSAKGPLPREDLERIEQDVRKAIADGLVVHTELVPLEEARTINTVRAVFGEQYPDPVRVVSIGPGIPELLARPSDDEWMDRSVEFCGGTHLAETGEAEEFVLLSEQGLAAGIRRITAVTGAEAREARQRAAGLESRIEEAGRLEGDRLAEAVDQLGRSLDSEPIGATDRDRLEALMQPLRAAAKAARKQARSASAGAMVEQARGIAEAATGPAVVERMDGADRDALFAAMDAIRGRNPDTAVLLVSADEEAGKVMIVARVPESLIDRGLKAGDWVRAAAEACGGRGGGRPDSAQAGGKDTSRADDAVEAARSLATRVLETE